MCEVPPYSIESADALKAPCTELNIASARFHIYLYVPRVPVIQISVAIDTYTDMPVFDLSCRCGVRDTHPIA